MYNICFTSILNFSFDMGAGACNTPYKTSTLGTQHGSWGGPDV